MNTSWQESETIEFKQSLAEKEEAGKDLCAFANKNGGTIYFGVKNNGEKLGLQDVNEKTIRQLSQLYSNNIQPRLYPSITIENDDGKQFIKIAVAKSSTPYHIFQNTPYIRVASTSPRMPQEEYKRRLIRYQGTNVDYSSIKVERATFSDLSPVAIKELRALLKESSRLQQNIDTFNDEQLLKNLQLIQDNSITVAALVLLGSEESLAKYLPYAEIRYGYKLSTSETRNQDSVVFRGGYLLYYNQLWEKINARNITLSIPHGLFLGEKKAFEEETIREAVNNAVMHRDYQESETIFIFQYPTSIEVKSPGGFVEGITMENILSESRVRNKLIADVLYRCEFVEQFGTGVNLMFKKQLSLGKNPPDYTQSQERRVVLRLDGAIQDMDFAKYVFKVADAIQKPLGDEELLLLYRIKNRQKVRSNEIGKLAELGLVEKVGYGKWMLSKKYYSDTEHKGLYTRGKGLHEKTRVELILQHLKEFPEGAKKQAFQELFPDLEWVQIWRILNKLRRDGKIVFTGTRRSKTGVYKLI